jgi:hypothetical protein
LDEAVTAASHDAGVEAGIGLHFVAIIAGFDAGAHDAIAARG